MTPHRGAPRRAWVTAARLAIAGALLVACSDERFEPPERTAAIRAEEARLAGLVAGPGETCRIRVLGIDGSTSYAWVDCSTPPDSGRSYPVRVDGTTVREPMDGGGYSVSIEEMFPAAMAKAILDDPDRMRPDP